MTLQKYFLNETKFWIKDTKYFIIILFSQKNRKANKSVNELTDPPYVCASGGQKCFSKILRAYQMNDP